MKISHTLEEVQGFDLKDYDVFPLSLEIFSDMLTPIQALRILKGTDTPCFLLESAQANKFWGRYTFLGFSPLQEISCLDGVTKIKAAGQVDVVEDKDPNELIQQILNRHRGVKVPHLPPFTGGLVGYFAYDYAKYSEPVLKKSLKQSPQGENHFRDVDLMLFDKVIAFDNFTHKIHLIVNIYLKDLDKGAYEKGVKELSSMAGLLSYTVPPAPERTVLKSAFSQHFNQEQFTQIVNQAKAHIQEGDVFQAVLSNRFSADFEGSLLNAYRMLRTINPSPYMFYFSGSHLEIAGASPETLVKLENGKLSTFPLAGTRPRGKTLQEDLELEGQLLKDEKELAEHNMLVDLGRNDLGKVSQFGSVKVEKYMEVLRFSHVMHIGSTVTADILPTKTGLDAINAVLPAGTLSGAPKVRAMEIISQLEGDKRGIYGGAVGYLDFTGNMDTCIAIRIAYKKGGKVYVRSGAGIVFDSDPLSEYAECLNKAKGMQVALERAGEIG